jgi:hypothetical protein
MGNDGVCDERLQFRPNPGVLKPFELKFGEYGDITGDKEVIQKAWENVETYATRFVWMVLTDI